MVPSSLVGQQELIDEIRTLIRNDQFPHTTMFTGPRGGFALSLALCTASSILNQDEGSHRRAVQLIHPDLHITVPTKSAKETSDDHLQLFRKWYETHSYGNLGDWSLALPGLSGNLQINVKECSLIQNKLSLKSYEGGAKVLIIWGAEYLGTNGNRLLKVLEEPPSNTYIMLVTEDHQSILPTILSRCQEFKLRSVGKIALERWLVDTKHISESDAQKLAMQYEGDVSQILQVVDSQEHSLPFTFEEWMALLQTSDFRQLMERVDVVRSLDKQGQQFFLKDGLAKLRQAFFLPQGEERIFGTLPGHLFDLEFVEYASSVLSEMMEKLDRNAHFGMMFMSESVRMWRWIKERQAV